MCKTALIVVLAALVSSAAALTCPYPFVSQYNGYLFNNCYYYAGKADSHKEAQHLCAVQGASLVTAKDNSVLNDLYNLYKAFPDFYFWVGASSTAMYPKVFTWQDGSLVDPSYWCSGHPKGGDNTCTFYSTTAVIGRDKCISSGPCDNNFFAHGAICHYKGSNINFGSSTTRPTTSYFIGKKREA